MRPSGQWAHTAAWSRRSIFCLRWQRYYGTGDVLQCCAVRPLESDPSSLDLPEEKQWTASFYGKTREISGTLRKSISETLVLLADHGNTLFQSRLGLNVQAKAASLVKELLTPLTTRRLEEHERDLPTYAEAAPEMFLGNSRERSEKRRTCRLRFAVPEQFGHLRTMLFVRGFFGRWRASRGRRRHLRARRASLPNSEKLRSKTTGSTSRSNSLESVSFASWCRKRAAKLELRLAVMCKLAERVPGIAWQVCVDQFSTHNSVGDYSYKPRWRNDGHGFRRASYEWRGLRILSTAMIEMALNWKPHTKDIGDLIERVHALDGRTANSVVGTCEAMVNNSVVARSEKKSSECEKIRITVMSRRGLRQRKETGGKS